MTPSKRGNFSVSAGTLLLHLSCVMRVCNGQTLERIRFYLKLSANTFHANAEGETAAHIMARKGFANGLDEIVKINPDILNTSDKNGMTPVLRLAEAGDVDTVIHYANLHPEIRLQGVRYAVQGSTKLTAAEKRDALEALSYAGF